MKKNTVLKFSPYTTALTRCLKTTERVHCRVNEETDAVYVCNGYFVVKLNRAEYDALVRPVTQRDASNFVIQNGEVNAAMEPLDMEHIMDDAARNAAHDVRLDETKSRIPAAVRAYFTDEPEKADVAELKQTRKERDDWEDKARRLEAQRQFSERASGQEITRLQKIIDAQKEQIAALTEQLNAKPEPQPAPVEESQPKQAPADKAAALLEKLTALDGITATIKGAQTAAPVVWLTGEAAAHREKIEAMGGKWSAKRSAWYFKVA